MYYCHPREYASIRVNTREYVRIHKRDTLTWRPKELGLCPHVLCINHKLQAFNIRYQLLPIGQKTKKEAKKGKETNKGKQTNKGKSAADYGRLGGRPSNPKPALNQPSPVSPLLIGTHLMRN